jgi:hypothetical protein
VRRVRAPRPHRPPSPLTAGLTHASVPAQPVLDVATLRRCLPGVAECDGEQLSAFVGLLYVRPATPPPAFKQARPAVTSASAA